MKKVLLATSFLVAGAGFAAAEVSLSGSARMGIIDNFGASDVTFTSRARVVFTLTGSSDSGLEFGATFRADNAPSANTGTAGEVWVSGAFGKLSMGDTDGAAQAAVGDVSGVGLTGLGDYNETAFVSDGGDYGTADPSALYEYSAGATTFYASVTKPNSGNDAYAVGVKYAAGNYTVAAAFERWEGAYTFDQLSVGATATFDALTLKAIYAKADDSLGGDGDQWALSVDYVIDALTLTAFYHDVDPYYTATIEAYGLGASYDLGGGASVKAGYVKDESSDTSAFDLGLNFAF